MNVHKLKCWPVYFQAIVSGEKTFEARLNDRDFKAGDLLELCEFNQDTGEYSDKFTRVPVTYILHGGQFGIEQGWCVMAIGKHIK